MEDYHSLNWFSLRALNGGGGVQGRLSTWLSGTNLQTVSVIW